jgi:hypothetical protein
VGPRLASTVAGAGLILAVTLAEAHDPITTRVTWTGDISRIVHARCVTCHSPDGPGPMPLTTYEEARPWAKAIKEEVMTRRMPKWHAARGYGDFSNDPSLSAFEIALVAAWADGGAPKGTDADKGKGTREERLRPERGAKSPSESERGWGPASADKRRQDLREVRLACGEQPLPEGTLLAVRPELESGGSAGIAMRLPDGQREIVAWIRNYDPEFPTTYRLRRPLPLPKGSTLVTDEREGCAITVTVLAPR